MGRESLLKRRNFVLLGLITSAFIAPSVSARAHDPFPVVIVDKSTSQILLGAYSGDRIELKKKFHVTLGKIRGDKEIESDLKTPEGVYFFTSKLTRPGLAKKFGKMALVLNYPNPIDQIAGKTGYSIMLHSTDDPPRLQKDLDSEGCVVVNDEQIEELSKEIKLGLTPIIIYPSLKDEYLTVNGNPDVRGAFQKWLDAWNGKNIDTYIDSYAKGFHYNGMNVKRYREYKASLNQKYQQIHVAAENVRFYWHPKYDVVSFTQVYESKLKNGVKGFKSSGTKYLYFVREDGSFRIADEAYSSIREE